MRAVHTPSTFRFVLRLVPVAALSLAAACDDSDGPDAVARIRFLHAAQGRAAVDFRADDATWLRRSGPLPGNLATGNYLLSLFVSAGGASAVATRQLVLVA